jgi:predicted transcriptional regulator
MMLRRIVELLDAEVLLGEERLDELEVKSCFAADLMSDVLRFSHAGTLLITGLTSVQSVHTADVADLAAILFVGDKRPEPGIVDVARARGIPLLTTPRTMFEACGLLFEEHLAAAARAKRGSAPLRP